jgi:predicted TIM-barrel fold metal-dependent hydrolase
MVTAAVIDTHVHFWDLGTSVPGLRWSWIETQNPDPILGDISAIKTQSFDVDALWAEAMPTNLRGFVHVQAAVGSSDPVLETRWLTQMRERSPVPFTAVAHADLASPLALSQIERHAQFDIVVGVRDLELQNNLGSHRTPRTVAGSLNELTARGLVLDLVCEYPKMDRAARLAAEFPELTIVLEHLGMPRSIDPHYFDAWRSAIDRFGPLDNVLCKISGLSMWEPEPTAASAERWVMSALETFGPARCVIGSNWPVDRLRVGYGDLIAFVRRLLGDLPRDAQAAVLGGNAGRIYRLDPGDAQAAVLGGNAGRIYRLDPGIHSPPSATTP